MSDISYLHHISMIGHYKIKNEHYNIGYRLSYLTKLSFCTDQVQTCTSAYVTISLTGWESLKIFMVTWMMASWFRRGK